jgi:hypothetical protein
MRRTLTPFALLFTALASAQPIIQNGDNLPQPGFIAQRGAGSTTLAEGPAGADQTWDFSTALLYADGNSYQVLDAATSPFASAFPTADYVALRTSSGSEYYFYYNNLPDRLEAVTEGISSLSSYDIFTADRMTKLKFPFAFGESATDTYVYDGGGTGSLVVTYDGYGTLITPLGTVTDVVRIKTIYNGGNTFYDWYTLNPLLRVFTYGQGDLEWYGLPSIGMDGQGASPTVAVYPNPMADQLSIQVEEAQLQNGLFFTLTNAMGQVVHQTPLTRTTTTWQRGDQAEGVYFYRIRAAERTVASGRIVLF